MVIAGLLWPKNQKKVSNRFLQNLALIGLYLVLTLYGIYQMKIAAWDQAWFYVGFVVYVASYGVWIAILKLNPLSKAYAVAAGSLIIATQLIDYFYMGEELYSLKIIGVMLVFIGISLIHRDASTPSEVS